jgi:hypothetical protein
LTQNPDLNFLGIKWEDAEIPKDKKYLLRYFNTPLQESFLKYVFLFGDCINFSDHTGIPCQDRWLKILSARLAAIELAHKEARANMDLTGLAKIESGKYKL